MNVLGAQLYTVRMYLETNDGIQETVSKIKEMGYDSVQLFGSAESAGKIAKAAKDAGLRISGVLADLDGYELHLDDYLRICDDYEMTDLGVSAFITDAEKVRLYIQRVNTVAQRIKTCGHTFSYHNHASEFIKLSDGKTIMEHYIEGFDAALVDFMPDTYWIHKGGCDVRYFLERLRGRVKILHLKDMKYTENGETFAEIGKGNLYF